MDTRTRIIEQASIMFFKYGIRSITMDEIAESLGISKRTLYENFSNKEELLKQCIDFTYQEGKKMRDSILQEYPGNPLEIIYQHFRQVIITFNNIHPNFFNDLRKYHSQLWRKHIESKQEENTAFTQSMIEMGIAKGVFRQSADPIILSSLIHSMMRSMTMGEMFPEARFSKTEVVRQVLINFIRGLATSEGLKIIDEKFK